MLCVQYIYTRVSMYTRVQHIHMSELTVYTHTRVSIYT